MDVYKINDNQLLDNLPKERRISFDTKLDILDFT